MMMLRILKLGILALLLTQCTSNSIYNIKYSDQNSNQYLVTQDTFIYEPMTKEGSSSGAYEGGEPIKKEIDNAEFEMIAEVVLQLKSDSTQHAAKRKKLISVLVITSGNLNEKFFIKPCESRDRLEELLKELKESE